MVDYNFLIYTKVNSSRNYEDRNRLCELFIYSYVFFFPQRETTYLNIIICKFREFTHNFKDTSCEKNILLKRIKV